VSARLKSWSAGRCRIFYANEPPLNVKIRLGAAFNLARVPRKFGYALLKAEGAIERAVRSGSPLTRLELMNQSGIKHHAASKIFSYLMEKYGVDLAKPATFKNFHKRK